MVSDEEQAKKSRMVVETPAARREVVETQPVRLPSTGVSGTAVAALVVGTIALITVFFLYLINQGQEPTNSNLAAQGSPAPQTTIIEQPAQQPPVIIQQAPPATQPAPIIVNPPAPTSSGGTSTESARDDASIQAEIDKKIADDPTLSALGLTATVNNGKVLLVGTVKSEAMKLHVERMVKAIKGVRSVDDQIVVG